MNSPKFTYRLAKTSDMSEISKLMQVSIEHNMQAFLSPAEIAAAKETMGLDTTLIDDQTYYLIEADTKDGKVLVGCGGWGKRLTLHGGNQIVGRDDRFCDPRYDPARIRAMYTHPDWTRCGVASLLLEIAESAAKNAGFQRIELGSTIAGEPFYLSKGYQETEKIESQAQNGKTKTVIRMEKSLV